jgi:hypothetical protein
MALSKALTPFKHIWPSLNMSSIKPIVRTGLILIRSLPFEMALILYYIISLLSS